MIEPAIFKHPRDRYVMADFRRDLGDGVEFILQQPVGGVRLARVSRRVFDGSKHARADQSLFLIRLSHAQLWMASIVSEAENPWMTGAAPRDGSTICGRVERFDGEIGVIVAIDSYGVVDAYLRREDMPDAGESPISDQVSLGDRVCGLARAVDPSTLRVEIDVSTWRRNQLQEAVKSNKLERSKVARAFFMREQAPRAVSPSPGQILAVKGLTGLRLLLVDNDRRMVANMDRLVALYGGALSAPKPSRDIGIVIEEEFARAPPTHVLLDYQLGEEGLFDTAAQVLAAQAAPVAILSGDGGRAREAAVARQFGYLKKPLDIDDLVDWCGNPHPAKADCTEGDERIAALWSQDSGLEGLRERIRQFLKNLRSEHDFAAGFWFRGTEADHFELRQSTEPKYRLPEALRVLTARCQFFGDATGESVHGQISANDPAFNATATQPDWRYFASVVVRSENTLPRALVMLSAAPVTAGQIEAVRSQREYVSLMVDALLRAEYHDGVEAFATQGRLAAGVVHEIRNRVTGWQVVEHDLREALDGDEIDMSQARRAVDELSHKFEEIAALAMDGLDGFRPMRRRRFSVNNQIERVVAHMQRVADAMVSPHHQDAATRPPLINFRKLRDPEGQVLQLILSVPGGIVEQALINLIDNALHFVPRSGAGRIDVSARLETIAGRSRVSIYVSDNGPGVRTADVPRLFEPRRTARGRTGTGLGLYVSRNLLRSEDADLELVETTRWGGTTLAIRLPVLAGPLDDTP